MLLKLLAYTSHSKQIYLGISAVCSYNAMEINVALVFVKFISILTS